MERSFAKEVRALKMGDGDVFHGEGILAITKALLQSGVSYLGGYQGAPVSHLMDVMSDASDMLDEMGIHFEICASEAAAAALCAASINYPMRGAVVWKSTVGTNVASDALSNLASAGVRGGTMIIIGEDYGEGASIIQERSHAFAMKSTILLMDPRPNHGRFVELIEQGFALSEVSHAPVMTEFRIRACHMHGQFVCKDNITPTISRNTPLSEPDFDYDRICLPPATYAQERHKIEQRIPKAIEFIREHRMNDHFDGDLDDVGIICQGGIYNTVIGALEQIGLANTFGDSRVPILCLNVTYPLIPDEIAAFARGKRAVLMVEEGNPDYLEQAVNAILRKADVQTTVYGKDVLPMAGEYTPGVVLDGVSQFLADAAPRGVDASAVRTESDKIAVARDQAAQLLGAAVPTRPPGFCTGCPERPVFSAIKLVEQDLGKIHINADIGCHTFSTLPPFNLGNSVLGYGLGLASSPAVNAAFDKRTLTIMGDGGFWHNGLTSGVAGAVFNETDGVMVIMDNGYSSATGQQLLPSSAKHHQELPVVTNAARPKPGRKPDMSIENALDGVGVKWQRVVTTYRVGEMIKTLKEAMTTRTPGLKVIIARSECQLARQRRIKPLIRAQLKAGERVVRTRFGIDEDTCTGDHSCIRLSGCPSLTIKPNPDPLRTDPVASVDNGCVGCGLCGEVADAAALCPSFYRADVVHNPRPWDRLVQRIRNRVLGALQGAAS